MVIVGLAAVALAAMFAASSKRTKLLRSPVTLSLSVDDSLWVGAADVLHRLDAEGHRTARVTLDELGVPGPLSHLHAVSGDDVLLSAGEPTRLYRCAMTRSTCRLADAGYVAAFGGFGRAVWIGADQHGQRVVVSDNARHRVAVLNAEGKLLAAEGGSIGRFHFPGQPVWVGDATIWLAGADRRNIERIEWTGDLSTLPAASAIATPAGHPVLGRSTWPLALAPLGDGRWWALIQQNMMVPGGLYGFDREGAFIRRADQVAGEARVDLTAVTRLGDGLVAADLEGPRLWRYELDGRHPRPFGSDELASEWRGLGERVSAAERMQSLSKWVLIGAPLVGVALLLLLGERIETRPARLAATPTPSGGAVLPPEGPPVELGLEPKADRELRTSMLIASAGLVLFLLLAGFSMLRHYSANGWVIVAVSGPLTLLVLREFGAMRRHRLSIKEDTVMLLDRHKVLARAPMSECLTDGRSLLIERYLENLVSRSAGARYAAAVIEQRLLPYVRHVSTFEIQRRAVLAAMRRRWHWLLLALLAAVAAPAATILLSATGKGS